jgi:hypothetical protein
MRIDIRKSTNPNKKMMAVFYDGYGSDKKIKTVHFGDANGSSFIDHKDEKKKDAWIERHKVRGTFNNPMSASSLSYHILWNKPTISASIIDFKKRFKII